MAITYTDALRDLAMDAALADFNGGTLTIRTGTPPGAGNPATGTVLATITLPNPAFNAAAAGSASLSASVSDAAADATGTAAHFRIVGATGVLEGTVTATGGGGDLELDNVSIQLGGNVTITSMTVSMA